MIAGIEAMEALLQGEAAAVYIMLVSWGLASHCAARGFGPSERTPSGVFMERRLAAVLVADMVGYSRLMGQDELGTLVALQSHRRKLIEPKLTEHGGRIVKTTGDGFLIEFPSATTAARYAVEVQKGMALRTAGLVGERRMRFRMGINIGEVIVENDDIFGDTVNVAARLEQLADPGGICLSDDVWHRIEPELGLEAEDLGELALKNIARPVRVHRLRPPGTPPNATAPARPGPPLPDKPSIAVLPFDNIGDDPEQDYFVDGTVEDIITALSRVRWLFVIARNSSFVYKGRPVDVRQIGRDLGVRYVLEGSVRKAGNRVRLTAQLIDAASGSHIWAERFDGRIDDIFELQDRMTACVVGAIEPKLRTWEIERSRRKHSQNLEAYDYFLRALPHVHAMQRDEHATALRLLGHAIELDPRYAVACGVAAWLYTLKVPLGWMEAPASETEEGLRLARQSIAYGADDPEALYTGGYALAFLGNALEYGLVPIDRALELNPNAAQAWSFSGWVRCYVGDAPTAVDHFQRAIRLSPLDPTAFRTHAGLAFAHFFTGRFDEAAGWARRAIVENPAFSISHRVLAASLGHRDRTDEARAAVQELMRLVPHLTLSRYQRETRFRHPAYLALLLNGLRRAGLPE